MISRGALRLFAGTLAVALAHPASSVADAVWSDRIVDGLPEFSVSESAVQVDASGTPHVFVGGDRVYHYWRAGDTWQSEVVDPVPRSGERLSAALGPSGEFHLVYVRNDKPERPGQDPSELRHWRYATNLSGAWVSEVFPEPEVPSAPIRVAFTVSGLAVDASHRPHISASRDRAVFHGVRDSGAWSYERVDENSGFGLVSLSYASSGLALDSAGNAHLLWFPADPTWQVVHAWGSGSTWTHEAIGPSSQFWSVPSAILIDETGTIHALLTRADYHLTHWSRSASATEWSSEDLGENTETFAATLAGSHVQVLGVTRTPNLVMWQVDHLQQTDSGWTRTTVLQNIEHDRAIGLQVALGVEPNGDVDGVALAAIASVTDEAPLTALHRHGSWTEHEIARTGPVVYGADVRLGLAGSQRRLLYRTGEPGSAILFHVVRHATEAASGDFKTETLPVDPTQPYVANQSLALGVDPGGQERALWNSGALSQSVRSDAGEWSTTAVFPEETMLASRRPALLVAGSSFNALYAAVAPGIQQSLFSLFSLGGRVGSIVLGGPILPLADPVSAVTRPLALAGGLRALHVAYVADDGTVTHATNASGEWVTESVGRAAVGHHILSHSLAVEADGTVHIAYEDGLEGAVTPRPVLVYGTNRCPGGWYLTELDSQTRATRPYTAVGARNPELTLDGVGNPHIVYRSDASHSVGYAHIRDGVWALETVVPDTNSGEGTAVAVDDAGVVSVAHHDPWAGELRLATREPLAPEPRWNGCPPLPDPNLPPDGSYFFAPPPTTDGVYNPTERVETSYGSIAASFDVAPRGSSLVDLENGFVDSDGDSVNDSQLVGIGKVFRKRGEIRVIEVSRLLDSNPSDATVPPKLKVLRAELIDLATRHRVIAEEASGKIDGKKVKLRRITENDVPLSAFAMRLELEIHPGAKGGLVASGKWPLGNGTWVLLTGSGKWSPKTSSFDLHLRGGGQVDFKLSGMRTWQHHSDGVYLSADSLAAHALGQTVKIDLTGAY